MKSNFSVSLHASTLIIYPKGEQSTEQLEKDKYECYSWAKTESGFDPMAPPVATKVPPQAQAPNGGLLRV